MREITSCDNRIYKEALSLLTKKYRDKLGLYLIEGENLLEEATKCNVAVKTVFIRDGFELKNPELEDKTFLLSEKLFNALSQTETPQGVIAIVEKKEVDLSNFKNSPGDCFLVLDRLQDPGNVGTIIRTADAAGYKLVIMIKGTADCFQPKVVRSATGSLFRMPVVYMASYEELREFTRMTGKKLATTTMKGSCNYYDCDLSKDICLVIGNEGNGIDKDLIESSDLKIKIPMEGNIESLNAAVSCGILLYERIRKCKKD